MHKYPRAILSFAFYLWATAALAQGLDIGLGLDSARNQNWVLGGASLDFDFTSSRFYQAGQAAGDSSLVTVVRASPKYCDDSLGNWPQASNNVLCFTDKGALIEEARTNSIRNNSMQGAVAGSPGTAPTNWSLPASSNSLSLQIVGIGTEGGIDYIDVRYSGTSSATSATTVDFDTLSQIAASYGQTWTASYFMTLVGGSLTNITQVRVLLLGTNGAAGVENTTVTFTPTAGALGANRRISTRTLTNSTTTNALTRFQFSYNTGTAIDATFRIGWPQAEKNSINSTVVSAAIAAGGASGAAGTAVYQVNGGTGTAPTLNVTVSGGAITAINSVANAGSLTVFPPSPAPLTYVSGAGSGVVGATVNLTPTDNSALGFATSPIRTTAAAATRAADVDPLTNVPASLCSPACTTFTKGTPLAPAGYPTNQSIVTASDNTANNRIGTFRNNTSAAANSFDVVGGAAQTVPASAGTWSQSTSGKLIAAFASNDIAVDFNGAAVVTSAANTLPAGLTRLEIGGNGISGGQWNGYVERIALWPTTRLPNATLQSLTQ
jgi:hypothetical protein